MEEFVKCYPESPEHTTSVTISFSEYKDMLIELTTLRIENEKLKSESLTNWSRAKALEEKFEKLNGGTCQRLADR